MPPEILCRSTETRFSASQDTSNYRELDISGVTITLTNSPSETSSASSEKPKTSTLRSRAKATAAAGLEIISDARLLLKAGQRYALVGRNGSGKSTLLRAIADKVIPGIPENSRIAILQQTRLTDPDSNRRDDGLSSLTCGQDSSVLDHVVERASLKSQVEKDIRVLSDAIHESDPYAPVTALRQLEHEKAQRRLAILERDAKMRSGARGLSARKAVVAHEQVVAQSLARVTANKEDLPTEALQQETQRAADLLAELELETEPNRLADIESRAKGILKGLGFSDAYMSKPLTSLSGGWHMRAALATALCQDADILILDEPTNFLDLLGIIWLQRFLQSLGEAERPPTVIIVSHDRDFVDMCTDLILVKDKQLTYFHGTISHYEASQSERRLWLKKMKDAQDKQKAHIEKSIAANKKAGKANDDQNKLRQAKSRQKKLDDRMGLQVSAKGGRFKLNRDLVGFHLTARDDIDVPAGERPVVIALPEPLDLRFPGALVSLDEASFRYASRQPSVVQEITLSVGMGDRVGILGLNGAGKTTLIRLVVGESQPTSGAVACHPRARIAYYAQHAVDELQKLGSTDAALTSLALMIRDSPGESDEGDIRSLLAQLGLPGRLASDVPLSRLSGGQLVRCALARLIRDRPHCLVLDEVTTHLDYETVVALREALASWEGAIIVVSHDRWFMKGVVEGIVDADEDDEDGDDVAATAEERRRTIYRLKEGKLIAMDGGTAQFERQLEKRVAKLWAM